MKVKVLKNFKDKHTGEFHRTGEIISVSKKRCEEILKVGKLVEECKEKVTVTATDNVPEDYDAEVAEGIDVGDADVVIEDEDGNVLDVITDETAEQAETEGTAEETAE